MESWTLQTYSAGKLLAAALKSCAYTNARFSLQVSSAVNTAAAFSTE